MLFSSNLFVFLFLPLTIAGYYLIRKTWRNIFLLVMSLGFYAWGEPKFVFVMIASIVFNYLMGLVISWLNTKDKCADCEDGNCPARTITETVRKAALTFAVLGNVGLLFAYKYLDFGIKITNELFHTKYKAVGLALPIGISFFTFQAMSYVIDVYRGKAAVQKKPHDLALYVSFFPQLIAGPIVRYTTVAEQIKSRVHNLADFSEGVQRFIVGFAKKIILANNIAAIADRAFNLPDASRSVGFAWLGAIAYSFQIFFDFSGYSDMAIGLGKMFGFHFLENFNYPYISKSVSKFWRRWHISLGEWFRDYVYFPLGGSRVKSSARLIFNLFVTWLLTGAWHGASYNFIAWGLLYFALISFEKLTNIPKRFTEKWQAWLYQAFTLLSVMFGWVLFRASALKAALRYIKSMLIPGSAGIFGADFVWSIRERGVIFILCVLASLPVMSYVKHWLDGHEKHKLKPKFVFNCAEVVFCAFAFYWSVSFLILGAHNPFIYFNF